MLKPTQISAMPFPRAQQASSLPLQALTLPASVSTTQAIDMGEMMNLMITMMIIVMMMKMMTGAMAGISD